MPNRFRAKTNPPAQDERFAVSNSRADAAANPITQDFLTSIFHGTATTFLIDWDFGVSEFT